MNQSKQPSAAPSYSLVIPAFDEATLIVDSLRRVHRFLKEQGTLGTTEVIVVAAKGQDNTGELARGQASLFDHFQLIEPGLKVGKGRDVKAGVVAAKGRYILFTDADLATPIEHSKKAFEILSSGQADVVMGVRNLWTAHKGLKRKILSVGSNWVVRIFLLPFVPDSQCGFKGFNRKAVAEIFPRMTIQGWGFDMEILTIAKARKLKIEEVFIADWSDPKLGSGLEAGESSLKTAIKTFRELFIIWRQRLKGAYR